MSGSAINADAQKAYPNADSVHPHNIVKTLEFSAARENETNLNELKKNNSVQPNPKVLL